MFPILKIRPYRSKLVPYTASILILPSNFKTGKILSVCPTPRTPTKGQFLMEHTPFCFMCNVQYIENAQRSENSENVPLPLP